MTQNAKRLVRTALRVVAAVLLTLTVGSAAWAADAWVEVRSDHFTVISNAGEKNARSVAWQFEQIRGAIKKGWPWTHIELDRPVVVLAVKDAQSMKVLAPDLFQGKNADSTWTSVFGSTPSQHLIALRADLLADDTDGLTPYVTANRSYSHLALQATFGEAMPLWLGDGFAGVLSNSIVRKDQIHFGRPLPDYTRQVQGGSRLRLRDLLTTTPESPYVRDPQTLYYFNAQAWSFVQYLLFGDPQADAHVPQLMQLILQNTPSLAAVEKVYGKIDDLETKHVLYMKNGIFRYATLKVDSDVTKVTYPSKPVAPARLAALKAGFHFARGRDQEYRAALDEARAADATAADSYSVEGMVAELQRKTVDAERLYARAAELGTTDYYTYFRLAALRGQQRLDREGINGLISLLDQAVTLNPNSGESLDFLSSIYERQNNLALALDFSNRAVKAEPVVSRYWTSMGRVLAKMGRTADARQVASDALKYAVRATDQTELRELLASLERPQPAAGSGAPAGGTVATGGSRPAAAPSASAAVAAPAPANGESATPSPASAGTRPPTSKELLALSNSTNPALAKGQDGAGTPGSAGTSGTLSKEPQIKKKVDPVYPAGLDKSKDFGTVIVEITIAPAGNVVQAKVVGKPSKFDEAALAAVRQWVYEPTVIEGRPVGVIMEVPVNFGY